MEIQDARGKTIEIGSYIRYTGTGTVGKVVNLKIDEDEDDYSWVKLENPNLWYSSDVVEVIDEKDAKIKHYHVRKEDDIDNLKNIENDFDDNSLTSGGAEGGG